MEKQYYYDEDLGYYVEIPSHYYSHNLSDRELLETFPEAKKIIPEKIKEWQEREKEVKEIIKYSLKLIKDKVKDKLGRWFWREVVKMDIKKDLLEYNKQIFRLNRLNRLEKGKPLTQKILSEDGVENAKQASIVDIASPIVTKLRKVGKNYIGLCPFHQEKHPSFYIYLDTNSFYCFGCQKGGDVIKFVELAYNYSFKQAVEYLTRR